jgi:deoxyribose-phosphate aldolase
MANAIFNSFKRDIANGSIDLDTDSIKLMLVTSTYVPNIDTHTKRSDVTNEVVGTGYTAGGVALANKTVTANNTTDKGAFDADDVVISTATLTARGAVLYKSRGGASTADELIAYLDFGADITSTAGNFSIAFDVNGILTIG